MAKLIPYVSCSDSATTHPGGDNARGQEINDGAKGDEELGDESFLRSSQCTSRQEIETVALFTRTLQASYYD